MSWADDLSAATRIIRDTYPTQAVIHYTAEGTSETVTVVYDRAYTEQGFQDGLAVTTTMPVVWIRDADATRRVRTGDTIEIGSDTLSGVDVQDEGSGTVRAYVVVE